MKIDPKHLHEFDAGRDAEDTHLEEEESVSLAMQSLTTSGRHLSEPPRSQPSPSTDTSRTRTTIYRSTRLMVSLSLTIGVLILMSPCVCLGAS